MKRQLRFILLLVPLAVGCLVLAGPSHAQEGLNPRFAFADTTLLRDTLDLKFDRLFPLSDSLRIVPDTLRALSVRYRLSLERLVLLADSLRAPIDSVGVMLEREQFNPLSAAAAAGASNEFRYTSSYQIGQTNSAWTNGSDYSYSRGLSFLHSVINITLGRYYAGSVTSLRQTRLFSTEVGYRLSPNLSLGGRANLQRFANLDRSIYAVTDNTNEVQLSMRSRQEPTHGMNSEFNVFSGILEQSKSTSGKNGLSGEMNGRMVYSRGNWMSQGLDGQATGNLARTRPPGSPLELNTHDLTGNLRGSLALFEAAPVGLNVGYGARYSRVENLAAGINPRIQPVLTNTRDLDIALRMRRDNDRYINLDQRWGSSQNSVVSGLGTIGSASSLTTSDDRGFSADGRYLLLTLTLDVRYQDTQSSTFSPRRTVVTILGVPDTVDYREQQLQHSRSIEGTLSRNLGTRLTTRVTGDVGLDSYDYTVDDRRAQPTYPRDQYNQSYRIEGLYTPSERFNTGVILEVARTQYLNLTSASSSSNSENHSYRGEWRWNARLLPGLTATQRNNVTASYDYLTFQVGQDRLSLDYSTVTTLNAVLSPRFTIDINHNARYQPRGGYNQGPDGIEYFTPGDKSHSYILSARLAYTPIPALSLSLAPDYEQFDRSTVAGSVTVPQSLQRTLNFSGGANLNMQVGHRGRLTGNINRTYNATRTTSYALVTSVSPRSELDYWNGSLQFTWSL